MPRRPTAAMPDMTPRQPRWKCALCPAEGEAETLDAVNRAGHRHYMQEHYQPYEPPNGG